MASAKKKKNATKTADRWVFSKNSVPHNKSEFTNDEPYHMSMCNILWKSNGGGKTDLCFAQPFDKHVTCQQTAAICEASSFEVFGCVCVRVCLGVSGTTAKHVVFLAGNTAKHGLRCKACKMSLHHKCENGVGQQRCMGKLVRPPLFIKCAAPGSRSHLSTRSELVTSSQLQFEMHVWLHFPDQLRRKLIVIFQ